MKIFMEFNHNFCELPLALATELRVRIPDFSICGVAWQRDGVFQRVAEYDNPRVHPLDPLDELERRWLDTPFDPGGAAEFESRLGPGTVNRLIMSDRNISHGFVNGAHARMTNGLKRATRDRHLLQRYVLGLLRYAFQRLADLRPDMVLVVWVDNAIPFALSLACEHMGIPFAQIMPAKLGQRHVVDDSREGRLNPPRRTFQTALRNPTVLGHQSGKAKDYLYRFRRCKTPQETLFATMDERETETLAPRPGTMRRTLRLARRLVDETVLRKPLALRESIYREVLKEYVSTKLAARVALRNGTFLPPDSIPAEAFIYYPLHVDPELATTVTAPMHTDQLAVVRALAMSLPVGMSLVVKEHVPMLGVRPKGFYEQLKTIPGVRLVSPFENSLSLVRNAALTCVITGTAGWEAIQLGKPALVVGEPSYLALGEGFVHCPDQSRLPEAVSAAFHIPPAREERLLLYIAALLEESFHFPFALWNQGLTRDTARKLSEIVSTLCDHVLRSSISLKAECQSPGQAGSPKPPGV